MEFEIAFLPVGEASSAGDAIIARYRENNLDYIYIIDGGTITSGEAIVAELRLNYQVDKVVIAGIVSTHPDKDHSSGLRVILDELDVRSVWMHRPWLYTPSILHLFSDSRWTSEGLAKCMRENYPFVAEIEEIATRKGISILEPYAGCTFGRFTVLSPSPSFYMGLIPQFDNLPQANEELLKQAGVLIGKRSLPPQGLLGALLAAARVAENFGIETLKDGGVTSATNESSVVLYGDFGGLKCLLTADAGRNALTNAVEFAKQKSINLQELNLIQIPHHGSRSNVSPAVLDMIVGPRRLLPAPMTKFAVASVPEDDAKHPRKIVLNAFYRRGAKWALTQGLSIYWGSGNWNRNSTSISEPSLFAEVEAYD